MIKEMEATAFLVSIIPCELIHPNDIKCSFCDPRTDYDSRPAFLLQRVAVAHDIINGRSPS